MLNIIWAGFFIFAALAAVIQSFSGNFDVWPQMLNSLFDSAQSGFKISLNLTGLLCFWLGLMKIAEKSGLADGLSKILTPLFYRIMPEVPHNSPAFGSMVMNIAANVLGLDNAATPMGLKAMEQLQQDNKHKDRASDAQILFMVINSSAVTLIPITILMYRYQFGSVNPAAVFIPILLATSVSTLTGFLATLLWQKINIFDKVILAYLLGGIAAVSAAAYGFSALDGAARAQVSYLGGNFILFALIIAFIVSGLVKRLNVYEVFIIGAKDGFKTAVQIIPYLVAMLAAIGIFRASGGLDFICSVLSYLFNALEFDTSFIPALPTALMKPLSGSGARAMMLDCFSAYGVDSFAGFAASVVQGSTETTFYVLAVYFGAVKISKTGSALPLALLADLAGIVAAISFAYMFYQE